MDIAFKQALKAKAHHLNPVILIGAKGITTNVIEETDIALQTHELIKVKINGFERDDRKLMINELSQATQAEIVQVIGKIAVIYRKNVD